MYSIWEGAEKIHLVCVEMVLRRFSDEGDLRRSWEGFSDWEGPPCICWDGFEKVFLIEKVHLVYVEMVLRRFLCLKSEMDLRRWEESEKEMYPPILLWSPNRLLIMQPALIYHCKSNCSLYMPLLFTFCEYSRLISSIVHYISIYYEIQ